MKKILLVLSLLLSSTVFAQKQQVLARFFIDKLDGNSVNLKYPAVYIYTSNGNSYMSFVNGEDNDDTQIFGKIQKFEYDDVKETSKDYAHIIWTFDWSDIYNEGVRQYSAIKVIVTIVQKPNTQKVFMYFLDAKGNISIKYEGETF
jgi:hypothetical protein